ncbi:nucleotide pyrophosphohydrolase [Solemya pervernicosa gill symbiont]|uniref:Nucleotide pyrophosphohydrolase n=2 Tax=Gammaproteobacteria incertae sedis TaxID=118884 RepID=A0A1T2L1N8_9GAMM|nr:nucleotide pyrophosphohydrolase [Candidatus Reidiella endopervernicosa]OOZ38992.1 nucleotide pyrophosphohydrolase [Solemya pervernicosa gill symbiont]QKQ25474.1 nucleotide pyrophosphohydrolase [Candidatus Reidiella endopervernicosa]
MTDTNTNNDSIEQLNERLTRFARDRDWEQFHSPKNLSMALIAEAAELVEHFQWLSEEQSYNLSEEKHEEVSLELADILIYLIRTAERLDIDLLKAAWRKVEINESRYPVEKVSGSAKRAEEYDL